MPSLSSPRFLARVPLLLLLLMAAASIAFADTDRTELLARFDELIVPAVEKAGQKPVTDRGGDIAWGTSYQLSAIVEVLEATRDPKYARLFVKLGNWVDASRDDRDGRRDAVRGQVVPAWSSTNYSQGTRYTWAVHTGMIAAPLARFAAVIRSDATLSKQWSKEADRFLKIAEEAVAVHDGDYREGPGASEGYIYSPFLKKHVPLNMQNALVRAWLAIDDAKKTPQHRERITRLAHFSKNRLRPMEDGSYVWAYWPPLEGKINTFEDISHAAINVDLIARCFEHDIVFTRADLERLEKTLLNRVVIANDKISDTVGGGGKTNTYRSAVLRWERLGRHSPAVRERIVAFSQLPEFTNDLTALAVRIAYAERK